MNGMYFAHDGVHVVSVGWYEGMEAAVLNNRGLSIVFGEPGMTPCKPPTLGALWNIKTNQWDDLKSSIDQIAAETRYKRDLLLEASDWKVIRATESGEPMAFEWITYRQALRDITLQTGYPTKVVWPSKPE